MPRGDRMPDGTPVMMWMSRQKRSDGPARTQIKRYEVDPTHTTSKKLAKRLKEVLDKKGTTWENVRYYDPPDSTRMHRPGSQKR